MYKCNKCHIIKSSNNFTKPHKVCKDCRNLECKNKYKTDKLYKERINKYNIVWQKLNKDKLRQAHLRRAYNFKVNVISHYSQNKNCCDCCGISYIEFLSIDHTNGGGNVHRKSINKKSGFMFYKWLIDNHYPKGYRVLCHNCNQAYGNFGNCPHKGKTIYTQFQ